MKPYKPLAKQILAVLLISMIVVTGCDNSSLPTYESNSELNQSQPVTDVPAYSSNARVGEAVPGEFIVILKEVKGNRTIAKRIEQIEKRTKGVAGEYYENTRSFTLTVPAKHADKVMKKLGNHPHVDIVEPDRLVERTSYQNSVRWNLDRVDQRDVNFDSKYYYTNAAKDVTVYVVDTGINYGHIDFEGRASFGFDVFGGDGADCDGHGTHVAATIGGKTWGVAKKANLVSVRVLDCDGNSTTSRVIAGINWINENIDGPSVVNMSLSGGGSYAMDAAIKNSIASGVTYIFAAGNSNADACNYSPSRVDEGITVAASTSEDSRASYSNYGSCVDTFAPGSSVRSAWIGSNTMERTISGSSMAAPHVAGAAAIYLQDNQDASPQEIEAYILGETTKNVVTGSNSTNNHLLYIDAESVKSTSTRRVVRRGSRW